MEERQAGLFLPERTETSPGWLAAAEKYPAAAAKAPRAAVAVPNMGSAHESRRDRKLKES